VGLGLVIVKQAATLLGLELSVRSRQGHGSCFSLWLPEARDAPAQASGEARGARLAPQAALRPG
jgi:K+-sensing histidine kinase KdpD